MSKLGDNILKLEGFGFYVTFVNSNIFINKLLPGSEEPTLSSDKCIIWDKLEDPPNQEFLNLINARFKLNLKLTDYNKFMKIKEIRSYMKQQKEMESNE